MIRRRAPVTVLPFLLTPLAAGAPVAAQGGAPDPTLRGDVDAYWRDLVHVWMAPLHADPDDLGTAVLFVTGVGAISGFDEPVRDWVAQHEHAPVLRALSVLGEDSPVNMLGRTQLLLPVSLGSWLIGAALHEPALRDGGLGCATANVANTLARWSIAQLVGRPRPLTGRPASEFHTFHFGPWEERSFPGGHASNVMACASFLHHRFDLGWADPLVLGLASLIGVTRTVDGAHWLSDTAFGIGFGYAVGKEVARRQVERSSSPTEVKTPVVTLYWQHAF